MARTKKPAKTPAMESDRKYGMSPAQFRAMEAYNHRVISGAFKSAGQCLEPHIAIAKSKTDRGYCPREVNGKIYYVPEDAPEAVLAAADFLMAVKKLAAATNDGDVKFVRELAIYIGLLAVDVMVGATSGKRLHHLLTKQGARISGSSKGGKINPVWAAAEKDARPIFENLMRGGSVSVTAAIKRTQAELFRLQREGKFHGKVPGLTCLREHLVGKPSSGK